MPDSEDVLCGCQHTKVRHPFSGKCNRSGCGCGRFRPDVPVTSNPLAKEIVGLEVTADEDPDEGTPADVEREQARQPASAGPEVIHVERPLADVSVTYVEGMAFAPDESAPLPTADEPPDPFAKWVTVLRKGFGSAEQSTRKLAIDAKKALDALQEALENEGQRAEKLRELEDLERRTEALRAELGIKRRGRPPASR